MKKCGMRDSREKGAGMRDQDPPSRPCMDGLLSRADLGEYERARQYMQLQNKYLTFKVPMN